MNWLISLLTGGLVDQITGPLERAYKAKLDASTNAQKLAAEQQIKFYEGQLSLAVQAAQSDKWWSPRSIMGTCAAIYVAKIVVWDTVLGLGITPNPGPQVNALVTAIVGFYFGSRALTDISARLAASFANRR